MTTISVTNARKQLFKLLEQIQDSHEPVHIASKKGGGVLLSESDWEAIQETLYLQSIKGMGKSIKDGMEEPLSECDDELKW